VAELARESATGAFGHLLDRSRERAAMYAGADSYQVCRGQVGGCRQALSWRCAPALNRLVAERLDSGYGYWSEEPMAPMMCAAAGRAQLL
jgi:hypothetical protein